MTLRLESPAYFQFVCHPPPPLSLLPSPGQYLPLAPLHPHGDDSLSFLWNHELGHAVLSQLLSKGSKTHPHPTWCPEVKEKLGVCGAKTLRPTELSGRASFAGLDGKVLPTGGPWGTQGCGPSAGGRKKEAFLFPRLGQWR